MPNEAKGPKWDPFGTIPNPFGTPILVYGSMYHLVAMQKDISMPKWVSGRAAAGAKRGHPMGIPRRTTHTPCDIAGMGSG